MSVTPRSSRQGLNVVLDCLLAFLLMAALLWPLFGAGFLDNWASIESTFIADARFLKAHWPHPQWQPLWYGGTRFDYIYPPALRYGTAIISMAAAVEPVQAYHIYIALFFSFGIAGVYLLARLGSGSRGAGWLAAASTALLSPSFLLVPAIRHDALHVAPWRLHVLVKYGEGPHITALSVLGFALIAAFYALRNGKPALIAVSAMLAALVVSNNFYGATSLALFFLALCWAVWVSDRDRRVWFRAAAIAALAYGLTAFWLVPSYVRVTLANMRLVSRPGDLWSFAVFAAAAGAFCWLTHRYVRGRDHAYGLFVSGACLLYVVSVLGFYWFDLRVFGEPGRLVPEMDMMIVLAAVEALRRLWSAPIPFSPAWLKQRPYIPRGIAVCIVLLAFPSSRHYLRHAWQMYVPDPQYQNRVEYRIQDWIAKNIPEARTMVVGSTRFWYDTWHDLAQVSGGSDQGILNQTVLFPVYQNSWGEKAEDSIAWFQAMGIDAVVCHGPKSSEIYHEVKFPAKFAGVLPVLYDDGRDDVVYRVPRRYPGLARVVDFAQMAARPTFTEHMDQMSNVKPYVALVEQGPDSPPSFRWEGTGAMRIGAKVAPGQGVLVQASYDPAWHAYSGSRELPIRKDALGQMLVETPPGDLDLRLVFEKPLENRIGGVLSALAGLAFLGLVGMSAAGMLRRPANVS